MIPPQRGGGGNRHGGKSACHLAAGVVVEASQGTVAADGHERDDPARGRLAELAAVQARALSRPNSPSARGDPVALHGAEEAFHREDAGPAQAGNAGGQTGWPAQAGLGIRPGDGSTGSSRRHDFPGAWLGGGWTCVGQHGPWDRPGSGRAVSW